MRKGPEQSRQIISHGFTIRHAKSLNSPGMEVIIALSIGRSVQLAQ
jgi:hypothetical protein